MKIKYVQLMKEIYEVGGWNYLSVGRIVKETRFGVYVLYDNETRYFKKEEFKEMFRPVNIGVGDMISFNSDNDSMKNDLKYFQEIYPLTEYSKQLAIYDKVLTITSLKEEKDYYIINKSFVFDKRSVQIEVLRHK